MDPEFIAVYLFGAVMLYMAGFVYTLAYAMIAKPPQWLTVESTILLAFTWVFRLVPLILAKRRKFPECRKWWSPFPSDG